MKGDYKSGRLIIRLVKKVVSMIMPGLNLFMPALKVRKYIKRSILLLNKQNWTFFVTFEFLVG
jgi:hypothetical protein